MHRTTAGLLAGTLAIVVQAGPALAEEQATPFCAQDAHFADFDFWLGNWRVTDFNSGEFAGSNRITKTENGCLVREHWTSAKGGTGFSVNYYNPNTARWRQVWVSDGYSIDYEGGLSNGAMLMQGTLYGYRRGKNIPFRGTWTPLEDGTVRQLFEIKPKGEQDWQVWFDGRYTREAGSAISQ